MVVLHLSSRPACSCIQMSLVKYCVPLYCPITRVKLRYYCSPFSSLQLLLPTGEGMRRISLQYILLVLIFMDIPMWYAEVDTFMLQRTISLEYRLICCVASCLHNNFTTFPFLLAEVHWASTTDLYFHQFSGVLYNATYTR